MTETEKKELQATLKLLDNDFKKKTSLEREILDNYKYTGLKFLLEQMYAARFFTLDEAPPGCPWKKNFTESIDEIIRKTFSLGTQLPHFINDFSERCRMIVTGKIEETWYVFYCCDSMSSDGRDYFKLFAGGPPDPSPVVPGKLKAQNWEIPLDLQLFYSVHNGFGPVSSFNIRMFDAGCILPADRLYLLGEIMNSVHEQGCDIPCVGRILPGSDVVTGHRAFPASLDLGCGRSQRCDFNNLLVFYDDGFGNSRCFYRKDNTSGAIYTVAYEHEQREIGELVDFFECADKVLDYFDE